MRIYEIVLTNFLVFLRAKAHDINLSKQPGYYS